MNLLTDFILLWLFGNPLPGNMKLGAAFWLKLFWRYFIFFQKKPKNPGVSKTLSLISWLLTVKGVECIILEIVSVSDNDFFLWKNYTSVSKLYRNSKDMPRLRDSCNFFNMAYERSIKGTLSKSMKDLTIYFNMHLSRSPGISLTITSSSSSHNPVIKSGILPEKLVNFKIYCSIDIKGMQLMKLMKVNTFIMGC